MRRPSTSDRKVTVGLIQTSCDKEPAVNLQRTLKLAERRCVFDSVLVPSSLVYPI